MRGGKREGAGGRPSWNHGKTKTIRVPIALAEIIIQYARMLDEGKSIGSNNKVMDLTGISVRNYNGKAVVLLEDLHQSGFEILPERLARSVKLRCDRMKKLAEAGIESVLLTVSYS